jgi:hypothetical protein
VIGNEEYPILLDSGSEVNLISPFVYNKFKELNLIAAELTSKT